MSKNSDDFYKEFDLVVGGQINGSDAKYMLSSFEWIAGKLFDEVRDRGIWFDGLAGETFAKRKNRQLEVDGKMWVADSKTQWLEEFHCRITDKTITKQGLEIDMRVGNYRAVGDIFQLL